MKNQLFEDLIESIKELPTEILEEMRVNMNEEDAPEITSEWVKNATLINGNQMRKDFEEWYDTYDIRTPQDPFYKEVAWEAFKASRETLVVELPDPFSLCDGYGSEGVYLEDVKEALESQGIKWK